MNVEESLNSRPVFRLEQFAEVQGKRNDLDAARNQLKYRKNISAFRLARPDRTHPHGVSNGAPCGKQSRG